MTYTFPETRVDKDIRERVVRVAYGEASAGRLAMPHMTAVALLSAARAFPLRQRHPGPKR